MINNISLQTQSMNKPYLQSVHVLQGDTGRTLPCYITDVDMSSITRARFYIKKPDGTEVYADATISGGYINIPLSSNMLAKAGNAICTVRVYKSNNTYIGTFSFLLVIEENPIETSGIPSSNEFSALETLIVEASNWNSRLTSIETNIDDIEEDIDTLYNISLSGAIAVSSISDMEDTSKIYLLKTDGKLYYHNGTAWVEYDIFAKKSEAATKVELAKKANKTSLDEQTRRINNLYRLAEGKVYEFETDNTNAYSKSVLSGAMGGAIKKLGGKTVVLNQLVQNGNFASDSVWSTSNCSKSVADNIITFTPTSPTANFRIQQNNVPIVPNHKYYLLCFVKVDKPCNFRFWTVSNDLSTSHQIAPAVIVGQWTKCDGIITTTGNETMIWLSCQNLDASWTTSDHTQIKEVMIVDLTKQLQDYASTITLSEASAINYKWLPYNTGSLESAEVESIDTFKADTTPLGSFPIPQEIQNLDGYGWSAGNVYNEVDFENKKFIKRVGSVDLGTLIWSYNSSGNRFVSAGVSNLIKFPSSDSVKANIICSILNVLSLTNLKNSADNHLVAIGDTGGISIRYTEAGTDTTTFKQAMNGVILYYELATPVETDISAYIDGTTIEVENGGTITFTQDGLHIPVPNEEEYLVQLANS